MLYEVITSGTTLGSNTKVNVNINGADQYAPLIAMDEVGDFVIVWLIKYKWLIVN